MNTDAAVVFDALPGQVFPAHVTSSDAGILAGQEAVNGQLSQPEQSTRWVRDAQRMRIHVALDQPLDKPLPTAPALRCSCTIARDLSPAPSPACRSTW